MATVYNRISSDVPGVQVQSGFISLAAAYASTNGTAPASENFLPGESVYLRAKLNENAARLDATSQFGGSDVHAVCKGLALTINPTTLVATVSAGQAMIAGIVELANNLEVATTVPGWNHFWLRQNKTVVIVPNSTAPPTGGIPAVYLGAIDRPSTPSGDLDTDLSGVVISRGGQRLRRTSDTNAPVDTPGTDAFFFAQTLGGIYVWDGVSYKTFSNDAISVYFGAMPHSAGDSTPHDDWSEPGGVHVTPDDRTAITTAASDAASAASASATALTNSATALTAAAAAATLAATAVQDDDPRNTNARTPTAHASSHTAAGSDPLALSASQILDLAATVKAIVAAMMVAGTNMTITYDAGTGKITYESSGGTGGSSPLVVGDGTSTWTPQTLILPGAIFTWDSGSETLTLTGISDS